MPITVKALDAATESAGSEFQEFMQRRTKKKKEKKTK